MTRAGALAAAGALALFVATVLAWSGDGAGAGRVAADAPAGQTLFRIKGCSTCHDGPDTRSRLSEFPDLSGARAWAGLRRPGLSAEEYVRQSIRDPSAFLSPAWTPAGGRPGMPALTVTEREVDALVAYLLAR